MRILIVTGEFPSRSQTFITNKVVELARRRHRVKVIASRPGNGDLDSQVQAELSQYLSINYISPNEKIWYRARSLFQSLAKALCYDAAYTIKLGKILYRRYGISRMAVKKLCWLLNFAGARADILHFEWATKAADYRELLELVSCQTVISCRGSDVRILPLANPRLAEDLRWLFSRVDRAHCVSRAVLDSAKQFGLEESKAFINYPSVDTGFFSPLTSERVKNGDRVHIVSTGRLHWVKGYEYSLLAVRLLIDRGYQVSYTLVGEGSTDDKTQLNFAIRDLDLQNVVSLAGPRSRNEVQHLLSQSDIYLLSSLSEGISNSALEAMAMELPVVVTDVGGMAEAIRDGVDGFVVPSRNPKALADRLESLIKDCDMRLQMGRSGRKSVLERFELQKQTDRFISCYEALLAAKPARQSLSLNSDGQRYETV